MKTEEPGISSDYIYLYIQVYLHVQYVNQEQDKDEIKRKCKIYAQVSEYVVLVNHNG